MFGLESSSLFYTSPKRKLSFRAGSFFSLQCLLPKLPDTAVLLYQEPTGLGTVALGDVPRSMYMDVWPALTQKSPWEEAFQSMWVERTTAQLWLADQKRPYSTWRK